MTDKIKINNVEYISIGKYCDNNDGIYRYIPENDNDSWLEFLKESDFIVFIWVISQINEDIIINHSIEKTDLSFKLYQLNEKSIKSFCKKYFEIGEGGILNHLFEDFIFGRFSESSEYKLMNLIDEEDYSTLDYLIFIHPANQIDQTIISKVQIDFDWENLFDQVFISSEYYNDFVKDVNGLVIELKKSLEYLKFVV